MDMFVQNIIGKTQAGTAFRKVQLTGHAMQAVSMCLQPQEDIGEEVHKLNEQALLCLNGSGKAIVGGQEYTFANGDLVIVPAGTVHNIVNTGIDPMHILTFYSPPDHRPGTVHATKADAAADTEDVYA